VHSNVVFNVCEGESVCLCVCVCVCERERKSVCVCHSIQKWVKISEAFFSLAKHVRVKDQPILGIANQIAGNPIFTILVILKKMNAYSLQ